MKKNEHEPPFGPVLGNNMSGRLALCITVVLISLCGAANSFLIRDTTLRINELEKQVKELKESKPHDR